MEIATEIEENISGYLLTITMMNALVGVASGIAMKLCGLGDPILRRPTAFLLNYIPILGRMTGVVIFFLVGIVTFDWPWYAFVPAGIYLLIHIAEGETITPMLPAKRFTLNPVLVTVSLFPLAYSLGHPRHAPCRASWRSSRLSPTVLSR